MREIALLKPELQVKVSGLIELCKAKGINITITQTLRTQAEQDALYAQGRTAPGKIVTNCKYPQSLHCWGVAADFCVIRNGVAIWDTAAYKPVGELAESLSLEWGGRWTRFPDFPHLQLPGYEYSALVRQYSAPERFIASWKEVRAVSEPTIKAGAVSTPGKLIDGSLWGPVRAIAEACGKQVVWDPATQTATIK